MPALVLAPDSFKGALSAPGVAEALALGLRRVWPEAEIRSIPMADGGEGTLDAMLAATGGERQSYRVTGADHRPVEAAWGRVDTADGPLAVLEAAQVVGLTLNPSRAVADRTSHGIGELLRHCLDAGVRRFMIGVGGSSSNDGGAGVLVALGVRLLDAAGQEIAATPAGLASLDRIDYAGIDARLGDCEITLMSDVQNPLCGPLGATAVFGPQKGVRPDEIAEFDASLSRFARLCDAWAGRPVSVQAGAGAAGGLGYVFQLLGARNRPGAEVVSELSGLDVALAGADWVITGEGRSDVQTLLGKVPYVVASHARQAGVPVSLVSGSVDPADLIRLSERFDGCFSITPGPMPLADAMAGTAALLADRAEQLARLVQCFAGGSGSNNRKQQESSEETMS